MIFSSEQKRGPLSLIAKERFDLTLRASPQEKNVLKERNLVSFLFQFRFTVECGKEQGIFCRVFEHIFEL